MSDMTLRDALERISTTPAESPLAGFASTKPGHVNLVFANTVETHRWIARGVPVFVGLFDRDAPQAAVEQFLRDVLGEPRKKEAA